MTISCYVIGYSNVKRLWACAIGERHELSQKMEFIQACNMPELKSALSVVPGKPRSIIISALTNPLCDHIKSVAPPGFDNLRHSVWTSIVDLLTNLIYPFCEAHKDSKVCFGLKFSV
jgi:hypothetical protein